MTTAYRKEFWCATCTHYESIAAQAINSENLKCCTCGKEMVLSLVEPMQCTSEDLRKPNRYIFYRHGDFVWKPEESGKAGVTLEPKPNPPKSYSNAVVKCKDCGITCTGFYCDVCYSMRNSIVNSPSLVRAQQEYEQENERRIRHKQNLLRD